MQTSGVHTINKSNADANLFKSNVPNIRTEAMLQEFKNQVLAVFWQNLRIISKLKPCNMQECKKEKNTKHLTTMGQAKHPCECGLGKVRQCMHFLMKFLGWSKIILVWISPLPSSVFVTMSVKQGMQANRIQYSALAYTTMRLCFTRHFRWVPPGFTNEASWEVDISQRLKKQGPCISSMITLQ